MQTELGGIATIAIAIILATLVNEMVIKKKLIEKRESEAAAAAAAAKGSANGGIKREDTIEGYIRAHYPNALS